jgi:hypothetical protein
MLAVPRVPTLDREVEHQQGHRDREDAVADRLQA